MRGDEAVQAEPSGAARGPSREDGIGDAVTHAEAKAAAKATANAQARAGERATGVRPGPADPKRAMSAQTSRSRPAHRSGVEFGPVGRSMWRT